MDGDKGGGGQAVAKGSLVGTLHTRRRKKNWEGGRSHGANPPAPTDRRSGGLGSRHIWEGGLGGGTGQEGSHNECDDTYGAHGSVGCSSDSGLWSAIKKKISERSPRTGEGAMDTHLWRIGRRKF